MAASESIRWVAPTTGLFKGLRVNNSLNKELVDFVPEQGNRVGLYICGPTVYDSSHMGHARNYLTFDIIRRILEDYFHYDVFSVMNVTDVDDKIIRRARENFLVARYTKSNPVITAEVLKTVREAREEHDFPRLIAGYQAKLAEAELAKKEDAESKAKLEMELKMLKDLDKGLAKAVEGQSSEALWPAAADVLAPYLDKREGSEVTDHSIFQAHALRFEKEFLEDMETLGVRPSHALTRVSEYIPEIIAYIERIIANGFAYESSGSVYFDTVAFTEAGHKYCKLGKPSNSARREGEGTLSQHLLEQKRHQNDFALWKKSRPGEPFWESPWGLGRPGWHIECSAMASDLLGPRFDLHVGGEDLKFPHHDNELAQAEAHGHHHQWVNYFIHSGHLNIDGAKMSKSLKNFISIRGVLEGYTPRLLRLLFLLGAWDETMDFDVERMEAVKQEEAHLKEFFMNVSARIKDARPDGPQKWDDVDKRLHREFQEGIVTVDAAIKNSFDTPAVMRALGAMIKLVNVYLNTAQPKTMLLREVADYVNSILTIFGLVPDGGYGLLPRASDGSAVARQMDGILGALRDFRDTVRAHGRAGGDARELLSVCDEMRDTILPELGVRLEDKKTGPAAIKLDDIAVLRREREEKQQAKEAKGRKPKKG